MKKIILAAVLVIAAGYAVPVPAIKGPVDKIISSITGDAGWLLKEKKCDTPLEQRQKGYCADK